ncbi:MAG: type pilus assembly protein PilA [Actinomycetota bacterium]|jgi:type IV pilus assembly protein PilA|nr:type pilus assembly protein PilA [Actinomycetota bacterium]
MLTRIRKAMEEKDEGFTLIELLVVIIIIGILAAIAIPVYLNQRNKGYDAAAKSDAKALANLEEAYLTDNPAYATVASAADGTVTGGIADFKPTAGVITKAAPNGASGFCIVSVSKSGKAFVFDSMAGGLSATAHASGAAAVTAAAAVADSSCKVAAPSFA